MKFTYNAILNRIKKVIKIDDISKSLKEHSAENKIEIENKTNYNPLVEKQIHKFKQNGGVFSNFALTESSLRCLMYNLLKDKKSPKLIFEFGGGQSTLFFNLLEKEIPLKVETFEHDMEFTVFLKSKIETSNIHINHRSLQTLSEDHYKKLFVKTTQPLIVWQENAVEIKANDEKNMRLRNAFYKIEASDLELLIPDAIIIDGPHGNGRSICFHIFQNHIVRGQLILIDDYHHYPFLDDLSRLFKYEIIDQRNYQMSNKGWTIVKIV